MTISIEKKHIVALAAMLVVGLIAGIGLGASMSAATAQEETTVDESLLEKLYSLAFHRPMDNEAVPAHAGKALDTVLNDIVNSEEHSAYTGLYTATKAYEEARRAPGELSQEDHDAYLDLIDSALATVAAWSDTLPEQALENRVLGPEEARNAIQAAYDTMDETAQEAARGGLFRSLDTIPSDLSMPSN
ncbi:MAG: hypothetical protein WDZ39_01265 [Candidatus Spechtbacterales bacterium]